MGKDTAISQGSTAGSSRGSDSVGSIFGECLGGLCAFSLQGGHQDLSTACLSSSLDPFERLPGNLPPTLSPASPKAQPLLLASGAVLTRSWQNQSVPFLHWLSWESQVTGSKPPISDHFNTTNPCHVRQSQHLLWKTLTRQREQSQAGPWPLPGNTLKSPRGKGEVNSWELSSSSSEPS